MAATRSWYLSGPRMTVQVDTRDGIIIWGAPVVTKFMGQPLTNLTRWMRADVVEEIGGYDSGPAGTRRMP